MMRRETNPFDRDREFAVILEDLRGKFDTFAEGLGALRDKVDLLYTEFGRQREEFFLMKADISMIKKDMGEVKNLLISHDKRLSRLEIAVN